MTTRRQRIIGVAALAVALLAGCSGGDEPDEEATAPTSTPVITAPPTLTPEEKAAEEIRATFEGLVVDLDAYYVNASDYGNGDDITWNAELVGYWPVRAGAERDITNWVATFRGSEILQVGDTEINSHDVGDVRIQEDFASAASSRACLDRSALLFVRYNGDLAILPPEAPEHQVWSMSWSYLPDVSPAGWYLEDIKLTFEGPC